MWAHVSSMHSWTDFWKGFAICHKFSRKILANSLRVQPFKIENFYIISFPWSELKTQRQIYDFLLFGVYHCIIRTITPNIKTQCIFLRSVSLVEITVQKFRLLFLTETDLKSFFRYCDKLRQWNTQTVVEHYRSVLHNDFFNNNYVKSL